MKIFSKVTVGVLSLALAFSVTSGASAQAMSYADLIKAFVAAGIISADKAAMATALVSATPAAASFTKNLTVGSSGPEVTALQTTLKIANATGYFGSATKAAVQAYQTSKGISATGFVGPLTRAALNGSMVAAPVVTTPGAVVTTPSTVVNSGIEGTLSAVQSNAGVRSTVYEGEKKVAVLAVQLEAKNSDISVQRIKLDLGTETTIYNKIYDTLYIVDGSTVIATADLNSNTVVKNGLRYEITLGGFNVVVPRNVKKILTVQVDVKPSIDSTDLTTDRSISLATTNPIRGVDGAGIDQYAGGISITRSINVDGDLTDTATIAVSANSASPKKMAIIASEGSTDNELDKVSVLIADFKAEKDNVMMTDLVVNFTKGGASTAGANASSTAYLFDGSTEIDSASISSNSATFSDIDLAIANGATKTLTVKVDIRNANGVVAEIGANILASNVTGETSTGNTILSSNTNSNKVTGSATGEKQYVQNVGILATLVSKSITPSGAPQLNGLTTNVSTSSLSATFTVKIKAVGAALQFGTTASTTPIFGSTGTSFKFYRGGVVDTTISAHGTSTDYSTPSGVTTSGLTNTWSLAEGSEVTVPVTIKIDGRSYATGAAITAGLWSVGLEGIQPNAAYASTFMAGESDWRTTGVSFP